MPVLQKKALFSAFIICQVLRIIQNYMEVSPAKSLILSATIHGGSYFFIQPEITLNAARHTEERMDLYYEKMKALMNNYQDLILENQMVLDELEQECQEKINENMAYALQYMDAYDYRMNLGKLKKEVNNIILIYGLCDMVNRAMTLVKYFTPNVGSEYYDVLYGCFCRHRKMTDMEIMLELGMSRASFYRKKKAALRYMGYYFF